MKQLMADETWMNGEEAVKLGLATNCNTGNDGDKKKKDEMNMVNANLIHDQILSQYKKMPAGLRAKFEIPKVKEVDVKMDNEKKPATIAELKAKLPEAKSDFILAQLEKGAMIEAAITEYDVMILAEQRATIKAQDDKIKELEGKIVLNGVEPVVTKGKERDEQTNAIQEWNDHINEKVKGGIKKPQAIAQLIREDPELHIRFIAAYNQAAGK